MVGHEDHKDDQGMVGCYLFEILVCENWLTWAKDYSMTQKLMKGETYIS
jgi:hypothetical protein